MLRSLSIRDFVIVDRLELEFSAGFTVLTGETGAGKSILVDALSLALGERGESGVVRAGCERAEIAAEFDIAGLPDLQAWLTENELLGDDAAACLLRRVVYADGRSRGFINGAQATMQQLRDAGDLLVDIYSQHAHHSLLKNAMQRDLLDTYGGQSVLAVQVAASYKHWRDLNERLLSAERNATAYADELAELRDQARELAQLSVSAQKWEDLQQEHRRLAHAASLLAGAEECRELLAENEFAVLTQLAAVRHKLAELLEFDDSLQEALDALDPALIQLEEADRFLKRYQQRAELDPERLAEADARIQAIHAAARKHRARPEELPELLAQWRARIAELEAMGDDGALARDEAAARKEYQSQAADLSRGRAKAAKALGDKVSAEMQRLALAGGKFEIALTALAEGAAYGLEQVEFLVAGHAGMTPRPLAKVASGGELSRISLAIRVVTAQQGATPTMIFDEVDVGIGGGVAEIVGQLLQRLGETRQVLVITHLPQVAAQGASHLRVSKATSSGQIVSQIEALDAAKRVEEIARMLGGVEITDTTRKHAAEMLGG
ncbi:MAG: DNA repair protein RecN [Nitrosomonadales bacterium]|nr:MAG: DNA repair protein RecN [Nitrosomonadales bacterium]